MIIFVGDKPSNKMKPGARPFKGAACEKRLMGWLNYINADAYIFYNSDTMKEIGKLQYLMSFAQNKNLPVVALGLTASKRLDLLYIPHFKLPHPSGRNRQINDKEFINKKLQECRKWIKTVS